MPDAVEGGGQEADPGPESLDAGMEAAFGTRPSPAGAPSVLEALENAAGSLPRILLRDTPEEHPSLLKVHPPGSPDGAQGDGRYRILGEIARGAVGIVYRGRDRDLGRDVAVKVLRPEYRDDAAVIERFIEEAQIGAQLQHPGVVPVYGLGVEPDGRPSFAMRLVKGRTLSALLRERKDPGEDRRRFLGILKDVCHAVAYAHARGVVHRDIKPANILVGAFGEVQVVDWGFAKVLGTGREPARPPEPGHRGRTVIATVRTGSRGSASVAGSVMGTPEYMPPEQALGNIEDLDERSDVFSLGAVLCEVLTGAPPYRGDEGEDLILLAAQARLDDARARLDACGADPEITALCRRCLSPDKEKRPKDAGEVAAAVDGHLAAAVDRARRSEMEAVEHGARLEAGKRRAARERSARRMTLATAAILLAATGIGGGTYLRSTRLRSEALERANREAGLRLDRAAALRDGGRIDEAAGAARAALTAARAEGAGEGQVRRAGTLLASLEEERERLRASAAEAVRNRRMVARLEEIRLKRAEDPDLKRNTAEYSAAFREYGIDPDSLDPSAAAALVRASPIAADLANALDFWALKRRQIEGADASRLQRVALEAGTDPARDRIRDAKAKRDLDALRRLGEEIDPATASASTLDYMASVLAGGDPPTDVEAALAVVRRALVHHPEDLWLNLHLGWWQASRDAADWEEGARAFASTAALRPNLAVKFRDMLADQLELTGDEEGARRIRDRLSAEFPAAVEAGRATRAEYATFLRWRRRRDEALKVAREAVAREPGSGEAWAELAACLGEMKDWEGMLEAADRAALLLPTSASPHYQRFTALTALGRKDEGDEAVAVQQEKLLESWAKSFASGNPEALPVNSDAERQLVERQVVLSRQKCRGHPRSAKKKSELAWALDLAKKPDEALEAAREAVALRPDLPEMRAYVGWILSKREDKAGAVAQYREAVRLDPASAWYRKALASHLQALEDWDGATLESEECVRLDPSDPWCHYMLLWSHLMSERPADALAAADSMLARAREAPEPDELLIRRIALYRAIIFNTSGLPDAAIRELRDLPPVPDGLGGPDGGYAAAEWDLLGSAYRFIGDRWQAEDFTRRNMAACVRTPAKCVEFADFLHAAGHDAEALEWYREAARAMDAPPTPKSSEPPARRIKIGWGMIEHGELAEGLAQLRKAEESDRYWRGWSEGPEAARYWMAVLKRVAGLDTDIDAIASGKRVPADPDQALEFAYLCQVRGRNEAAVRLYGQALDPRPEPPEALTFNWRRRAASAALGVWIQGCDETTAARLRGRALQWLRADLAEWGRMMDGGGDEERGGFWPMTGVFDELVLWKWRPEFEATRGGLGLGGGLPEEEARAWEAFWKDVDTVHDRALRRKRP